MRLGAVAMAIFIDGLNSILLKPTHQTCHHEENGTWTWQWQYSNRLFSMEIQNKRSQLIEFPTKSHHRTQAVSSMNGNIFQRCANGEALFKLPHRLFAIQSPSEQLKWIISRTKKTHRMKTVHREAQWSFSFRTIAYSVSIYNEPQVNVNLLKLKMDNCWYSLAECNLLRKWSVQVVQWIEQHCRYGSKLLNHCHFCFLFTVFLFIFPPFSILNGTVVKTINDHDMV